MEEKEKDQMKSNQDSPQELPERPALEHGRVEKEQIQDIEFEDAVERSKVRDWSDVRAALEAIAGHERQRIPAMSRDGWIATALQHPQDSSRRKAQQFAAAAEDCYYPKIKVNSCRFQAMAKYCLKKISKRQSCAKRYKIEKKVRDHNKKVKKEAKKLGRKKKAEKVITVPKACPFKEEILEEAEKARERLKAQIEAKKEASKQARAGKRKSPVPTDLQSLSEKAAKQGEEFEKQQEARNLATKDFNPLSDRSIKAYASEVRKMIETADIIIQVLDARDPLGSRSASVEQQVLSSGKRLVLLLNKIDLVPRDNVAKWLTYLRTQLPTIAFKASTQEQNTNISRFSSSNLNNSSSAKCIGADLVMKLLGNYCRNKDIKTSIRVGIVGFPNVGKSSVINSLKRRRACNVGALPGITKEIQEIEIDKHIRLIDSPGVVLLGANDLDPVEVALKNAIRVDSLMDPVAPVYAILRRCSKEMLMLHYSIPEFNSTDQFLALVARKLGRLKKGARPDTNAAAKHVLHDWNSGRLRYYTQPPEEVSSSAPETGVSAEIVNQFSKEFDIDALDDDLKQLVEGLPMDTDATFVPYNSANEEEEEELEGGMEVDANPVIVSSGKSKKVDRDRESSEAIPLPTSLVIDGNVQLNRVIKKTLKKNKRAAKKQERRTSKLTEAMDVTML
ncbi:unnamed protein product [Cylicocyclus nassatus]|uniref:Guanine nucleotide-binding protein-like 3 homolog n=1 Tax=Cylicocyclus nassatus TaxID=53992 RepID=A0AA36ME03_CYLNA|nr:unnamed protein product [Cylicocyclus nassatus]